jgi:hypothetical protein
MIIDRRTFVRLLGGTGLAVILPGCARGSTAEAPAAPRATSDAEKIITEVAPQADQRLTVINASFEQLTGTDQPFAFGLTTLENEPVKGAEVRLYVVAPGGDEKEGPFDAEFQDVEAVPLGLYLTRLDFAEPGTASIVAVTDDGAAGFTALQITAPEDTAVPAPGQPAVVVPTPTFEDPRGVEKVCTLDPPCGMHEVSLDEALAAGRPVMLTFATPAYCMTAICGPSVETIDGVRASRDWDDVAWIHVEIYRDAGQTLSEAVEEWGLPSEPWLFALNADETVAARADGPLLVLPEHVARVAEQLA